MTPQPLGWWTISGEALMKAFYRCHSGEHPDVVYAELYANSEIEYEGFDDEPEEGE